MSEDTYKQLKRALELSNDKNDQIFKGFSQKLNNIDSEVKNILHILKGDPEIPTQIGLATTVHDNSKEIFYLKSEKVVERITILETKLSSFLKGYYKLFYKLVGAGIVILFLLGMIKDYFFKIFVP